ncbi:hypothetical protein ACSBR1_022467 [Camellia fascicularis]
MLVICDLLTLLYQGEKGGNATTTTNELGLQIRRLCPLHSVKSWRKIDESTKDAVVQAVLDKFVIGDDFDNDEQAQEIHDRKAYLLFKDWRYNVKQEFLELEEKGVDDPYSHPPSGVSLEDWKYLIDVAWKDESHLKRSKAGKANRSMLPYNHTSGSRSFPIAMSLMDDMVNLQVVATDARLPLTHEELSRQVLGAKENYLRGCGIGPQPSSTASSAARARDKHMELIRVELEVLREDRQRDHEELLKEKEERQKRSRGVAQGEREASKRSGGDYEGKRGADETSRRRKKSTEGTTSTTQSSERRGVTAHNPLAGFRWSSYYSINILLLIS